MTKEEFHAWKNAEANKPFFAFLKDRREALKEDWAEGVVMDEYHHSIALIYGDLLKMTWEDVAQFYGIEQEDKADDEE